MTDAMDRARTAPTRSDCTHPARLREATTQAWHSAMATSAKPAAAIFDFRDGICLSRCAAAQAALGAKEALFSDVPFSVPVSPERRSTISDVPLSVSHTLPAGFNPGGLQVEDEQRHGDGERPVAERLDPPLAGSRRQAVFIGGSHAGRRTTLRAKFVPRPPR